MRLSFTVVIVAYVDDAVEDVKYEDKSTCAQASPVAVVESALRKYPLVPTVSLPTVSAAVPTIKSPLASITVLGIAVAKSKAVKVIISRMSLAARAARDVMLVPLDAV